MTAHGQAIRRRAGACGVLRTVSLALPLVACQALVACQGSGEPDEGALLVESVRRFALRDAELDEIDRQVAVLRALDLSAADVRAVRDACVSFREALRTAHADRLAASAHEAAGALDEIPPLLSRAEAAVERAERFGIACEQGVHGLATR